LLSLAAFAFSGCGVTIKKNWDDRRFCTGIYGEARGELICAEIPTKPVYVPVHEDDKSFISGGTNVNVGGKRRMGFGIDSRVGGEAGSSTVSATFCLDGTFRYWRKERQQVNDLRDADSGSFVQDKIYSFSAAPIVGIDAKPAEFLRLYAGAGPVLTHWRRSWGHDRFNHDENTGARESSTKGILAEAGLAYDLQSMIRALPFLLDFRGQQRWHDVRGSDVGAKRETSASMSFRFEF